MERPELDRLRDDAQKGVFEAVLINDVDRLARDVAHLGVIKRDLEKKGIRVIFRKLPSDASPTYNLMVNILGSFAEFEREMIADRTRRGRRHKVEVRKQYLGGITDTVTHQRTGCWEQRAFSMSTRQKRRWWPRCSVG
jgi:DNA invertase Pin-like site-specific DNA recombinase